MAEPDPLPTVDAIDVALSGGGFRATLFHLGVFGYLRERQLLARIRTICSVSGGSILAAHAVINWKEYNSTELQDGFRQQARELTDVIRTRNLSGEVLAASRIRLLRLKPLDSERLVEAYDTMIRPTSSGIYRWDDLNGKPDLPELHILATHLNTGTACSFSRDGFHILVDERRRRADHLAALKVLADDAQVSHQKITRAVAASSAFPPIFSPLRLSESTPDHFLTDGGVYDNSGVKYLTRLYDERKWTSGSSRMPLIIDAGHEFPLLSTESSYENLPHLALRVTDAQANRIAQADTAAANAFFERHNIKAVNIAIYDRVGYSAKRPAGHSDKVQDLVSTIRTELDTFSPEEALDLYRHGYLVAHQALARHLQGTGDLLDSFWTPVDHVTRGAPDSSGKQATTISDNSEDGFWARFAGDPDWTPPVHLTRVTSDSSVPQATTISDSSKEELEASLSKAHIIKKHNDIRRLLIRSGVGAIVFLLALGASVASVGSVTVDWLFGQPTPVQGPSGELRVYSVTQLAPPPRISTTMPLAWQPRPRHLVEPPQIPAEIEPFVKFNASKYVYLVKTSDLGTITEGRPYTFARVRIELGGPLSDASIYAFLRDRRRERGYYRDYYVALPVRLGMSGVSVPDGNAENWVDVVVASESSIDEDTLERNLTITVE